MTKGKVVSGYANIKTKNGSPMPSPVQMQVGDYAFGTKSVMGSDLIGFDHFYRKDNTRIELGRLCKANAAHMEFSEEVEPGTTPPPDDPTPPVDPKSIVKLLYVETAFELANGSTILVRTEPVLPVVP